MEQKITKFLDLTERLFEDENWYKDRIAFCKFVISASVGLTTLLIPSRDKLPTEALHNVWWLYRLAILLSSFTAFMATWLYFFTYRNRYFLRFVKNITEENVTNKFAWFFIKIINWRARFEQKGSNAG